MLLLLLLLLFQSVRIGVNYRVFRPLSSRTRIYTVSQKKGDQTHFVTSYRRATATICPRPAPLLPWAPKRLPPPSRRQRGSSFPRPTRSHAHRCSSLTRQHGSEQSGLVTLTFNLLTLKVVSESRVTCDTSVSILVFLGLSILDLSPMYASDVRQKRRLTPPPIRGAGIIISDLLLNI